MEIYQVVLKVGYNEIVFSFDDFYERGAFLEKCFKGNNDIQVRAITRKTERENEYGDNV